MGIVVNDVFLWQMKTQYALSPYRMRITEIMRIGNVLKTYRYVFRKLHFHQIIVRC